MPPNSTDEDFGTYRMAWFDGARFEQSVSFERAIIQDLLKSPIDQFDLTGAVVRCADPRDVELPLGWAVKFTNPGEGALIRYNSTSDA
jgi:hypothetical protein